MLTLAVIGGLILMVIGIGFGFVTLVEAFDAFEALVGFIGVLVGAFGGWLAVHSIIIDNHHQKQHFITNCRTLGGQYVRDPQDVDTYLCVQIKDGVAVVLPVSDN